MTLWKDVRFAGRQLRKSPAFTTIVLATLGLCIGVNAAIYSVLDSVLLRTVPYPEPGRLALVTTATDHNDANPRQTGALFEAVRDGVTGLEVAAYSGHSGVNFAGQGHLEVVEQQRVSAGYFHVLGVVPQYGREFTAAEDITGGPALVIVSNEFSRRIFHDEAGALGGAINLRGEPYTVIGVMPRDFRPGAAIDVWTPLHPTRRGEGSGTNYGVVARLKAGVSWEAATAQLQGLSRSLMQTAGFPQQYKYFEERIVPLQQGLTRDSRSQLVLTWGAVLVVLVIGCVNIAGLMLARSAGRYREVATRLAVGASRSAIVRQLLTESLLLALGGCAIGIAIGMKALAWLKALGAGDLEMWHPIELDVRVVLVMLAISVMTALLFGLAPAIQTSRLDLRSVLMEGGRAMAGGRRHWSRNALVAGEVALTLVLLVGAGLLVRTLAWLNGLDPGFDSRHVISAQASLADARYQTGEAVNKLYTQTLDRIRKIPDVESAAVALSLPFERPLNDGFRTLDGDDLDGHLAEVVYVTPEYFETMRIPLRRGRAFRTSDAAGSGPVAIVSEAFVRKYYARHQALGGHVRLESTNREIVGVAGDIQQHSGIDDLGPLAVEPTVYVPAAQMASGFLQMVHTWYPPKWVIRARGSLGSIEGQVQSAVAAVDPLLPIGKFQTMDDLRGGTTRHERYSAALFSTMAGLALLLAALGLAGLISQSVTQRTHELGVRMALGASMRQAMLAMIRPGLVLAVAGMASGYVVSRVAVRLLDHLLWGVRPTDPATFIATAGILLVVALVASLVPSLRILRIDPAKTLRGE